MEDKYKAQKKYSKEKMQTFPLKLKKELLAEFKTNIDDDKEYTSATQFLKEKIEEYNRSKK